MKSQLSKRIASFCIAAVMASGLLSGLGVNAARTVDDIKSDQSLLQQRQDELKSDLENLKGKTEEAAAYQQKLKEEIALIEEQINTAKKDITVLDTSIASLSKKVEQAETEYQGAMDKFKNRVKALYTAGGISTLEILLSADSLEDYNMRSELMKSMTKRDKLLMEEITGFMKSTEKERVQLKEEKAQLAELKKSMETKTDELEVVRTENQQVIETLQVNTANTEKDLDASYAYGDDLADQMSAAIAQMNASRPAPTPKPAPEPEPEPEPTQEPEQTPEPVPEPTEPVQDQDTGEEEGGNEGTETEPTEKPAPDPTEPPAPEPTEPPPAEEPDYEEDDISFAWPCPGYISITGYWGDGRNHKGTDMAANYGTPIYAAESGTVMIANSTDSWGYSWGYYVSIYHDSTYSTLYAHCSSLAVSAGQEVSKGQVIAYVGSTGNSSGNHLHFEVYQNGTRIDPMQFF